MDLDKMTASRAAEAVRSKEITARELTEACLSRCTAVNKKINSLIHIFEDRALGQADAVDQKVKQGAQLPPLAGVPAAVKDDLSFRDAPTTWGAAALQNFRPAYHAAAVQNLIDAGAVIVGKTNLDQFGMGSSTATSFAGPTLNPRDPGRVAGDGAAAAVAAGQCLLALSSDSGGALRIGAAYCGLYGLRPTTGMVSRYGLNTFTPSFARVGIVARDAGDACAALELIAGYDPRDAATAALKGGLPRRGEESSPERLRVGFPAAVFDLLDAGTRAVLEEARESCAAAGVKFVEISLPLFREALQAYYVIAAAEASSNLGRFDGIRFGVHVEGEDLEEWYTKTRGSTFGAEAKRRSVIGAHLLSKDNFDRYYRQAQKVWALVRQDFYAALKQCSLIALPAAAAPPGTGGTGEFPEAYREDRFCAPVSLSGLPALSVPAGEVDSLPVGLQLVGPPFTEAMMARLASRIVPQAGVRPSSGRKEDGHGI